MKKINKTSARKLFDQGKTIRLFPCKANINSPWWAGGVQVSSKIGETFDQIVNAYEWYNCNSEAGRYAHFYIDDDVN